MKKYIVFLLLFSLNIASGQVKENRSQILFEKMKECDKKHIKYKNLVNQINNKNYEGKPIRQIFQNYPKLLELKKVSLGLHIDSEKERVTIILSFCETFAIGIFCKEFEWKRRDKSSEGFSKKEDLLNIFDKKLDEIFFIEIPSS